MRCAKTPKQNARARIKIDTRSSEGGRSATPTEIHTPKKKICLPAARLLAAVAAAAAAHQLLVRTPRRLRVVVVVVLVSIVQQAKGRKSRQVSNYTIAPKRERRRRRRACQARANKTVAAIREDARARTRALQLPPPQHVDQRRENTT